MKQLRIRRARLTVQIADRQRSVAVDRRLLRRAVMRVLRDAGISQALISVAVVDDDTIAQLNWRFLRHRGPADVLSFLLDDGDGLEGEVIVGAEVALRTAVQYGWSPHDELLLYAIHGTLHLVGQDDRTPRQRAAMQKRERNILEELGIERR
jgi:probable rRNA maturation factor